MKAGQTKQRGLVPVEEMQATDGLVVAVVKIGQERAAILALPARIVLFDPAAVTIRTVRLVQTDEVQVAYRDYQGED